MSVPINKQIAFYDWQLKEMDLAWKKYHGSNIRDLYHAKRLYIGRIWGYDDRRGVLILRFKEGEFPRLNTPLTLSYPKSSMGPISKWNFSYGDFRARHVEYFSDCTPVYYLPNKKNEKFRYVGVKNISLNFLLHIKSALEVKSHPIIILGDEDPPKDYLLALRHFTQNNHSNNILNLSSGTIENWSPKNLTNPEQVIDATIDILNKNRETIIQGPPGTGKTFLIAEICRYYLNNNKNICITALTHKALMEAAIKEGLEDACKDGKVHKTIVSADDLVLIPKLQNHDILKPVPKGELLLSTYHSLSKLLLENKAAVHFDLMIIEEASQAFLTTIAGFSSLADKVLVVGDFMQLQPIVLEDNKSNNIDKNIHTLIQGLKTYSVNNQELSYRLINSYRLSNQSAQQTGVFYDNSLKSLSGKKGITLYGRYSDLFCAEGGSSLFYMNDMDEGRTPLNAVNLIIDVIQEIKSKYPNKEIAVLAPFRNTVNFIIDRILNSNISFKNLEVNTVDRIQGMTVDICIYIAPSYKTKFSFDDNRFNVATSRAKNGTLIIAENLLSNHKILSKKTIQYLDMLHKPQKI